MNEAAIATRRCNGRIFGLSVTIFSRKHPQDAKCVTNEYIDDGYHVENLRSQHCSLDVVFLFLLHLELSAVSSSNMTYYSYGERLESSLRALCIKSNQYNPFLVPLPPF